jgi:ribosomal protein S20
MKIWKIVLGFFGLVGGLFALQSSKKKEVKTVSKKQVGNLKRKLTNSKKKTKKMQEAYDNDDVESAEDFLSKFSKGK